MKDLRRVSSAILGLLLLAGGCVAPSPPAALPAAAPQTSAQAGGQTIVAIAPPAAPQQTLPQWLGVNDLMTGLGGLAQAKHQLLGMLFPQLTTAMAGLEPPPAIKSLTDPANLGPDAPPGVKDVAQVKKDEDAAPQKIAAIKYAAGIGCVKGHPGIERAFLQFLDDPTESVRYEAAKGLAEMIGTPCVTCAAGGCCTPKIYKKLSEIVTKEKSPGCYVEYSDRVRRMARLAMHNCGAPPQEPQQAPDKIEGPGKKPLPKKEKIEGPVPPPPAPGVSAAGNAAGDKAKTNASKPATKLSGKDSKVESPVVQTNHQSDEFPTVADPNKPAGPDLGPSPAAGREQHPVLMVQWERVSVPFANFSSHKEAFAAVSYLRARVLGARLVRSPGFRKDQVSVQTFDWTDLNTVSPSVLARTLKSLPIGQVSPVLKDRQGYHLVRVLRRQYRHAALVAAPNATPTGAIIQTGVRRIGNPSDGNRTLPSNAGGNRVSDEQWPPDLSGSDLRPAPKLPAVDENAERPPLPKPDSKFIDIRPTQTAPEVQSKGASAFPTQNVTPPKTSQRDTIQGFDPFPADPEPQNRVRNNIASPLKDGKVFGDDLEQRRPVVAPATHWNSTQPGADRYRQPRAVETIPDVAPASRLPRPRTPAVTADETNARGYGRVQIAIPSEPRHERTVPTRPIVQDVPERPANTRQSTPDQRNIEDRKPSIFEIGARPAVHSNPTGNIDSDPEVSAQRLRNDREPSRRVLDKLKVKQRRPSIPATDSRTIERPSATRSEDFEPAANAQHPLQTEPREPERRAVPFHPTPRPPQTTAETREPERKAEPKPRRRGNVTIQTGRRSPMREISFAPAAGARRTRNGVRKTSPRSTVQRATESKPKPAPKTRNSATASPVRRVKTSNRHGTASSIRYVPVDSLRKRNASRKAASEGNASADAKRPASTGKRSKRKQDPIYFSRTGSRTSESGAEPAADRN
jgi:hypothetical protein